MLVLKYFLVFGEILGGFNFELKRLFYPDDKLNPKKEKRLKRKQEKQRQLNQCLDVPNGFVTQFADLFLVNCHQGFCLGANTGGTFNCDNGELKPKAECTCCSNSCDGDLPTDPETTFRPPISTANPFTQTNGPAGTTSGLVLDKFSSM